MGDVISKSNHSITTDRDLIQSWQTGTGTVADEVAPPPIVSETQTSYTALADQAGFLRRRTKILNDDVTGLHQDVQLEELTQRSRSRAKLSERELLNELSALGFAWRDIARMTGVSVPAVQKWRRGESASGENRFRLAQLVALCDMVGDDHMVADVGGWFEVPISTAAPVTPLDLLTGEREDLVLEHASEHVSAELILDRFDEDWSARYRSEFEVFVASDGNTSLRPRADR